MHFVLFCRCFSSPIIYSYFLMPRKRVHVGGQTDVFKKRVSRTGPLYSDKCHCEGKEAAGSYVTLCHVMVFWVLKICH